MRAPPCTGWPTLTSSHASPCTCVVPGTMRAPPCTGWPTLISSHASPCTRVVPGTVRATPCTGWPTLISSHTPKTAHPALFCDACTCTRHAHLMSTPAPAPVWHTMTVSSGREPPPRTCTGTRTTTSEA
eukprot:364329-Chlamydomonas_euryale.AAC.12